MSLEDASGNYFPGIEGQPENNATYEDTVRNFDPNSVPEILGDFGGRPPIRKFLPREYNKK